MSPLTAVLLLSFAAFAVAQTEYTNPCQSGSKPCLEGTPTRTCGYDSFCVGNDRATGQCMYMSPSLGCGAVCNEYNITFGGFKTSSTCAGTICAQSSSQTAATCGSSKTNFAPFRCECSTSSTDTQCRSSSCVNSRCAVASGSGLWGFPCTANGDCASNACGSSNTCTGRASGAACATSNQCAKGLTCYAGTCQAFVATGAACTIPGRPCLPFANCDTISSICRRNYEAVSGSVCSSSKDCAVGLACVNSVCGSSSSCGASPITGGKNCKAGQYCGCDGTNPVCIGTVIPQTCADAINDYAQCIHEQATQGRTPTTPENYMETPTTCVEEFKALFCSRQCAGPGTTYIDNLPDYNLVDCAAGKYKTFSDSQTNSCTRTYCPGAFNAATSASPIAAAVVALAAAATALVARKF